MAKYIATIQEGHPAQSIRDELASGLKAVAEGALGDDPATTDVVWKIIPKGFGWTAGRPSNSSVLLCVVSEDLQFKARANFMSKVNDLWVSKTGADPNELLIYTQGTTL